MIGKVVGTRSGVVFEKEAQRFAAAVGDLNPIYFDDEAAKAQGYKGIVAPPMFLPQVPGGVTRVDQLTVDGLAASGNRPCSSRISSSTSKIGTWKVGRFG